MHQRIISQSFAQADVFTEQSTLFRKETKKENMWPYCLIVPALSVHILMTQHNVVPLVLFRLDFAVSAEQAVPLGFPDSVGRELAGEVAGAR